MRGLPDKRQTTNDPRQTPPGYNPEMPKWPPELDAVIAALKHHRVLLENDSVRVLETRIEPGEIVPVHTHQWPAMSYVLSWGDFVRRDDSGGVMLDSIASGVRAEPGSAMWTEPLGPHTLEVVGDSALHVITVESKRG